MKNHDSRIPDFLPVPRQQFLMLPNPVTFGLEQRDYECKARG